MEEKKYGFSWIYEKTKGCRPQLILYTLLVLFMPMIQLSVKLVQTKSEG